jgi:hypothetical protein
MVEMAVLEEEIEEEEVMVLAEQLELIQAT